MNDLPTPDDLASDSRRAFLLAAFEDTEATIRATDAKASIALVVHGFVFAGMIAVLSRLGTGFEDAPECFRALVIVLTALTGIVFLGSISQLLRCVMPTPASAVPTPPTLDIFHLDATFDKWMGTSRRMPSFDVIKERVAGLTDAEMMAELTAELLKVSAIRARKVALASSGFELLGVEVAFALSLLTSLAIYYL